MKYQQLSSGDREKTLCQCFNTYFTNYQSGGCRKRIFRCKCSFLVTIYNYENVLINLLLMNFNIE